MHNIVVGAKPHFPKRVIIPNAGDLNLRCGGCGGTSFIPHVKPLPPNGDYARVTALVCDICKKHRKVSASGVLESIRDRLEREHLKGYGDGK